MSIENDFDSLNTDHEKQRTPSEQAARRVIALRAAHGSLAFEDALTYAEANEVFNAAELMAAELLRVFRSVERAPDEPLDDAKRKVLAAYLDDPDDRLWHAKDRTWWRRDDSRYVGALVAANAPRGVERESHGTGVPGYVDALTGEEAHQRGLQPMVKAHD